MPIKLKDIDFRFENTPIKIIANRNHLEIKLAGLTIGPLQEGNEYELYYWIAQELTNQGITHFREEDTLDATKLYKIQWKERVQAPGQIGELPDDFYPKLSRYIQNMKDQITRQPEPAKVQEYERTKHLASDIINSRLKKIVNLSSGPAQTDQITKKLTPEEKQIYLNLSKTVNEWRTSIIQTEG